MLNKLGAITLLTIMGPGPIYAAQLTVAEATFLDLLVTAGAVVEQRCPRYEANGTGGVQRGARLLGAPDAAMAMIDAYAAAILALDGNDYYPRKLRPEVYEAVGRMSKRLRAEILTHPERACAKYGELSVAEGLLRRY